MIDPLHRYRCDSDQWKNVGAGCDQRRGNGWGWLGKVLSRLYTSSTSNHQHQHQRQNYIPCLGDVAFAVNNLDFGIWSGLTTYSPDMMIIRNDTDLKGLEKEFWSGIPLSCKFLHTGAALAT
jgi:hypothetical protein